MLYFWLFSMFFSNTVLLWLHHINSNLPPGSARFCPYTPTCGSARFCPYTPTCGLCQVLSLHAYLQALPGFVPTRLPGGLDNPELDFNDRMFTLSELLYNLKTSWRNQMISNKCLYNNAFSAQLSCVTRSFF